MNPPMPIYDSHSDAGLAFAIALVGIHILVVAQMGRFKVSLNYPCARLRDDHPTAARR